MIKIGVIDDHKIVRNGLKELLEKIGNFRVIHEFEDGRQFLASIPLDDPAHVYIIDYSMPGLNGVEVLQKLQEAGGEYRVLLLSQHFEEKIIDAAYYHGARGFLHKNCTAHELKFAIENIVNIGYNNISEILKRVRSYDELYSTPQKSEVSLSAREMQFLTLVCNEKEYTYEQMAAIMNLSVKSIEAYRTALFERFNIKSKVGLVLFSHRYKLTDPFRD